MFVSWWLLKQRVKRFRNTYFKSLFIALLLVQTPRTSAVIRYLHCETLLRFITFFLFNRGAIPGKKVFSTQWYRQRYQAEWLSGCPMLFHASKGEAEDRDPSPYFSTSWYRARHVDQLGPTQSPLVHFLLLGHEQKLETHPLRTSCTATPKRYFPLRHAEHLLCTPRRSWGRATPSWMLALWNLCARAEGHSMWMMMETARFVEFDPAPVRADEWCERHRRPVLRVSRSEYVRLPAPEMSINDKGTPPPKLNKVGLSPYVAEPGPVYAIGGTTLFIASDGAQCFDSLVSARKSQGIFLLSSIFPYGNNAASIMARVEKRRLDRAIILTHDIWENYYHWMIEVLPRLLMVLGKPDFEGCPILLDQGLHPNMVRAIKLLAPNRDLVFINKLEAVYVADAIFPSCVNISYECESGYPKNSHVRVDVDRLSLLAKLLHERATVPQTSTPKRIYVTRKGFDRDLINANEVEKYLIGKGFDIVDTSLLDLDTQIYYFYNADIVVMPGGSAATNILFCREGAAVCTLHQDMMQQCVSVWQALACSSSSRYFCIFGDRRFMGGAQDGPSFFNNRFSIQIDLLDEFLSAVIGQNKPGNDRSG